MRKMRTSARHLQIEPTNPAGDSTRFLFSWSDRDSVSDFAQAYLEARIFMNVAAYARWRAIAELKNIRLVLPSTGS
jgi:hypothetical protein